MTPTPAALIGAFAIMALLVNELPAQQRDARESAEDRQTQIRMAAEQMSKLELRYAGGDKQEVELLEKPLLTFGDPARAHLLGTLWAFGKAGRPVAFVELFQHESPQGRYWLHCVTQSAADKVSMANPSGVPWAPEEIQIDPQLLPDAAAVADKPTGRLRQIKEQSRRFTAHEFWDPDNSRFELRLLVQPALRYSDPKNGIQDGAAFVLAHDTNPEIVLLIEALGSDVASSRWHFSLARLGSAELHVELDGTEVWRRDRPQPLIGKPSEPYWMFFDEVKSAR